MLLNYEFPTHVIFQKDALAEHAEAVTALGHHALVVMDAALADDHPARQEVLFLLEWAGMRRTIFRHTRKTAPGIAALEAGAALARESAVDMVIAVGCDATLETGKAIALLAAQDIREATLLSEKITDPLPVVAIPTEPASGTETTPEIHVAQHGLDRLTLVRNPLASPKLALLDPRYTLDMPQSIVISNYIKSMGRAIEAVTAENATPISDALAIAAMGGASALAQRMADPDTVFDEEMHEQLMVISHEAGLAISLTSANILEALASPLTYQMPVHLGQAYGLIIPPVLSYLIERTPLVADVIMKSLNFSSLEALEDFLWALIGAITPLSPEALERAANAAASNPLIRQGVLGFDFKEICSCYAHLLAEDGE